mgnify:CR=1 FL=1
MNPSGSNSSRAAHTAKFAFAGAFLGASFSGELRHQRRLAKVLAIEAAGTDREG